MSRWRALFWIAVSELFALSLWFSASAILDELKIVWHLNSVLEAWVTASVQIGFIAGTLVSSSLGLADRYNARKIFVLAALLGAILNGSLVLVDDAFLGLALRFLTGIAMAGVYPTAVKLLSQWFPDKRGTAIGILVAALTLGSALPHLVSAGFESVNWRLVIITSSVLALLSSAIMNWMMTDISTSANRSPVSFNLLRKVIANKPVMLANFGYFGHQWELYAMWTWLPAFLYASFIEHAPAISPGLSGLIAFVSIGVAGAIGCVAGGHIADKIGRSRLTIAALSVSAACSLAIGFTFGHAIWVSFILAFVWGMAVIADSAQFSAAVTEFSQAEYVGTALTFQMSIGFLITIISINLIPVVQQKIGWKWVFSILSMGPILGILAMHRLRHYEKKGSV